VVLGDNQYQTATATLVKEIDLDGNPFQLVAQGGYSMNADGTHYQPNVNLALTENSSGWTSQSDPVPGQEHVKIIMKHVTKLDNQGTISTVTGVVGCELN
jgi:hypothetical protein